MSLTVQRGKRSNKAIAGPADPPSRGPVDMCAVEPVRGRRENSTHGQGRAGLLKGCDVLYDDPGSKSTVYVLGGGGSERELERESV